MNLFPVAWPVVVALPELKQLTRPKFLAVMNRIRLTPPRLDSGAMGRAVALSLTVPFVAVFCLPLLWMANAEMASIEPTSFLKYSLPLTLLTIYLALSCFSYLNAKSTAAEIRSLLASLSAGN